jgi:hypothetical protein
MPPQQGVRRRDCRDLPQRRAADSVRSRSQPTPIIVGKTEPTSTKLTPQEPVLFNQVRDDSPRPPVQPAVSTLRTTCNAARSITSRIHSPIALRIEVSFYKQNTDLT